MRKEFDIQGLSFAAIDFETATEFRDSACALGVAVYENGEVMQKAGLLIRPPGNEYSAFNTYIHGIGPGDTASSPEFPEVWEEAAGLIDGRLIVAHNVAFDVSSVLRRCFVYCGLAAPSIEFACTYRLARSLGIDSVSFRLPDLADWYGIGLKHHDPMSDAVAAGELLLRLTEERGGTLNGLLEAGGYTLGRWNIGGFAPFSNAKPRGRSGARSKKTRLSDLRPRSAGIRENTPLHGKRVCFTGKLTTTVRDEAHQMCVDVGARPITSVSRKTDYLVMGGDGFLQELAGGKSGKQRAAEELSVLIITEDEFFVLLEQSE